MHNPPSSSELTRNAYIWGLNLYLLDPTPVSTEDLTPPHQRTTVHRFYWDQIRRNTASLLREYHRCAYKYYREEYLSLQGSFSLNCMYSLLIPEQST